MGCYTLVTNYTCEQVKQLTPTGGKKQAANNH